MREKKEEIVGIATRLFAESGFDGVSVRDICAKAKVSVAMVNYHFKNKEGLYRECLERLFHRTDGESLAALADDVHDAASWKAAVRQWVVRFSTVMHAESNADGGAGGIFRQEVMNPSVVQPFLEERYGLPVLNALKKLIAMAVETPREVDLWVTSIWAQLSAYAIVAPVWQRHFRPDGEAPAKWGEEFAKFVCEWIFKGLGYKKRVGSVRK